MPRKPNEKLPTTVGELDGLTKAAILLLAVGQDGAALVLKSLDQDQVEEVTRELAGLGRVPDEMQSAVMQEFYDISIATRYAAEGN
ncbi:MAG: hypothetical protein AAGK04_14215, partial [Planctomycetota bacterium]